MKQIKKSSAKLLCLLFLCSFGMSNVQAQTLVGATTPDNALVPGTSHTYLNSALIDYSPICPTCPNSQLGAVAISDDIYGSGYSGQLVVFDGVNSNTLAVPGVTADVVIGNGQGNKFGTNEYIVAVVSALPMTTPCGLYDILLTIFAFQNVGLPGGLTLDPSTPKYYIISNGRATANAYPHIDIIPEYSTAGGHIPNCNKIVVSFTDTHPTFGFCTAPQINLQLGVNLMPLSLDDNVIPLSSIPFPVIPGTITANWGGAAAYYNALNPGGNFNGFVWPNYADVSAAETGTPAKNVAYYTYTDNGNFLWVQGFDFTSNTPIGSGMINFLNSNCDKFPRIEAMKENTGNILGNGLADYMVVDNDITLDYVQTYSNLSWYTTPNISGWTGTYPDTYPVITGSGGGPLVPTAYTAGYFHLLGSGFNAPGLFLTQDIDWTTGFPVSSNYYVADQTPIVWSSAQPVALSSTCNNDGLTLPGVFGNVLGCWSNYGVVFYKMVSSIAAWKHEHNTGMQAINISKEWKVGPNPATDHMELYKPIGLVKKASYKITDMLGKEMIAGGVNGNTEQVSIGNFAAGMYILHIYEDETEVKTEKFVKQ